MRIKTVFCTLQFEGIHCWPQCPYAEVKYLRDPHRHVFHVRATAVVTHDDRDVEFIMLKHKITRYLETTYPDGNLGSMSCEMLAEELLDEFNLVEVCVSEDGENGGIVVDTDRLIK